MAKYNVFDCTMVELDKHHSDRKGNLTVVENGKTLPFDVKRVYYLYDVPGGENRGSHAHRDLSQLIIAASGSFRVTLDDGTCKRSFFLNRPYQGLYIKPGMWRDLEDFSSGAVCMVLASDIYQKEDYIRDYDEFLLWRNSLDTKYLDLCFNDFDRLFLDMSFYWLNDPYVKKMIHASDVTREGQEVWYKSLKSNANYKIWGISYRDIPIGVGGFKIKDKDTAELFCYIGDKNMRGKGLGAYIIDIIENKARDIGISLMTLYVRVYNTAARSLYSKKGYTIKEEEDDRIFMVKKINNYYE